ncbi:MAG TPA: secondary thiamine-phosphate synthase enzyme YjbQ [Nitriliruptorales bacterium]|nr:secondary thiamine-phosphate synthase enzyme YjbQ [Nitriliruptorales bacterium]
MGPPHSDVLLGPDTPADAFCSTPSDVRVEGEIELTDRCPVIGRATVSVHTERAFHVVDVTDHARVLVRRAGIRDGLLVVYTPHTTCAVKINERETCFLEDFRLFMEQLVPSDAYYRHDDYEIRTENLEDPDSEPVNGHAHIKSMLVGSASEHVPVVDGELAMGSWQRIMFIELDQARPRRVVLQVQGWR